MTPLTASAPPRLKPERACETGRDTSTPAAAPRSAWVDLARAIAIIAVVLFHVSIGYYYGLEHADPTLVAVWDRINAIVTVVRMPLLFAISGFLAANKIARGPRGGSAIESAVTNYYLYAVWLTTYGLLILLSGDTPVPFQVSSAGEWFRQFYAPNTPLWYVFALAIYIPAFTALRRVPAPVMLTALLLLHLTTTQLFTLESPLWTRGLTYACYFGLGVYGRRLAPLFTGRPRRVAAAGLTALALSVACGAWIGLDRLMSLEIPSLAVATATMVLYIAAGVTAVALAAAATKARPLARLGGYLGRRTLGVYVLHCPVITVLVLTTDLIPPLTDLVAGHVVLDALFPVLATAAVIGTCLLAERLLKAVGLGFLFALPDPIKRVLRAVREDDSPLPARTATAA